MNREKMIAFLESGDGYDDLDYHKLSNVELQEWCTYQEKVNLGMTAVDFFSEDPSEGIDGTDGYLGSYFAYPGETYDDVIARENDECDDLLQMRI